VRLEDVAKEKLLVN